MSLGGFGWSQSWREAISGNVAQGIVVVVAAGNSAYDVYGGDGAIGNGNEFIPAAYPEALTVSAMHDSDGAAGGLGPVSAYAVDDAIASFSNFGASVVAGNPVASSGGPIDVAAPGVSILSTYPGGTYALASGTSMAAPHVTGSVALIAAANARATDAAGVALICQTLIDAGGTMNDWRPDDADINSDRDVNHEPITNVASIGDAAGEPAPDPTPEPTPESTPSPEPTPDPTPSPPPGELVAAVATDKAAYGKRDTVRVDVSVTSSDSSVAGVSVALTMTGANGKTRSFSSTTNSSGVAKFKIKVNFKSTGCGVHTLDASASLDGYDPGADSDTFTLC
jgi:hypothetical protein